MPITHNPYFDFNEPTDDAVIWRYLSMPKFQDMMANDEFYFCRPDKFGDKTEGVPTEKATAELLGLNPLALDDRQEINNHRGFAAQIRENYFIMCWTLKKETVRMWGEYAPHGVAICSRYRKLKAVLHAGLALPSH